MQNFAFNIRNERISILFSYIYYLMSPPGQKMSLPGVAGTCSARCCENTTGMENTTGTQSRCQVLQARKLRILAKKSISLRK